MRSALRRRTGGAGPLGRGHQLPARGLSGRTPPPLAQPPKMHPGKPEKTMVDRLLRQRILAHGPVAVSDFMQEVLTAPVGGYYTEAAATDDNANASASDTGVFGARGDFVTAPEISQLFGELLGLWCVSLWQSAGSPPRVELVELGPGRGKMMSDILRTAKHFPAFGEALSVSMVEASPNLIRAQAELMSVAELTEFDASETGGAQLVRGENGEEDSEDAKDLEGWVAQGVTANGVPVQWYRHFGTAVPPPPSPPSAGYAEEPFVIVLANEYFDALPARQFQLTDRGWCEVCVDVADEAEELMDGQPPSPYHLKWTLSPQESPAVAAYVPFILEGERQRLIELNMGMERRAGEAEEGLPTPEAATVPGVDPTAAAGGVNIAAERVGSATLMLRKLDAALREGVIDEAQYEGAKKSLESQGLPMPAGKPGAEPAKDGPSFSVNAETKEVMERMEVCPGGLAQVQEISAVLQQRAGAALIIDYGADRTYSDSLQAVRGHAYHDVLKEPGTADVSTSVDFRALSRAAQALAVPEGTPNAKGVEVHGPITQGELMMGLGIEARLSQLVSAAGGETTELGRGAIQGATRLVDSRDPTSMGRLFKCLAITSADVPPPEPFGTPTAELPV